MKQTKTILFSVLVFLLSLILIACRSDKKATADTDDVKQTETTTEVSSEAVTTETETDTETEAPAYTVTLADKKESDYVIVCDTSDAVVIRLVEDFVSYSKKALGVQFPVKDASEGPFEHEIIVGNVRDSVAPIQDTLESGNDFAVRLVEDDLILCASDSRMLTYAFSYLKFEHVKPAPNKVLTMDSYDDLHYSRSELSDVPFFDY